MFDTETNAGTESQPAIHRVVAIRFDPRQRGLRATAALYHAYGSHRVSWETAHPDTRLKADVLVRVYWKPARTPVDGVIPVTRVAVIDEPIRYENLFLTVPSGWVRDRELVERASRLWEALKVPQQELFNRVFWEGGRFARYCQGPSSLNGHHSGINGNLRHSVESAEAGLQLRELMPAANTGIVILSCLLHDAGKADEYQDRQGRARGLTDRGQALGHRVTIIEWLAVARARMRLCMTDTEYVSLLHALTSVSGAPPWTGIRQPMTPEAMLLSHVDRLSGQGDLVVRQQSEQGGWGSGHPHLGRPFLTLGPKPKRTLPSCEAMLKLIREGKEIPKAEPLQSLLDRQLGLAGDHPDGAPS